MSVAVSCRTIALSVAVIMALLPGCSWTQGYRDWRHEVRIAQANGTPLVRAIEAFARAEGREPKSLDQLVPKYIPSIPSPGPAAMGEWIFQSGDPANDLTWIRPREAGKWALGIAIRKDKSPNSWSFGDFFVYHQTRRYPHDAYGGVLERFGDWAYYHE